MRLKPFVKAIAPSVVGILLVTAALLGEQLLAARFDLDHHVIAAAAVGATSPSISSSTTEGTSPNVISVFKRVDTAQGVIVSYPEPSVTSNGIVMMGTWNTYAFVSPNSGRTLIYMDPAAFPYAWGGACCDQVAYYDPNHDLTFWQILYFPDLWANNGVRIAWAKGQVGLAQRAFCYIDITPQAHAAQPSGVWFDYPKLSVSAGNVYLVANRVKGAPHPEATLLGSSIVRVPINFFTQTDCPTWFDYQFFNLVESWTYAINISTSPSPTTAEFATQNIDPNVWAVRLQSWEDASPVPGTIDIPVTQYPNLQYDCSRRGIPNSNWCAGEDDRIQAAVRMPNSEYFFMWNAAIGVDGHGVRHDYPYILTLHTSYFAPIEEITIGSSDYAAAFPSAAVNNLGHLGGTFLWGGGSSFMNCSAFIRDDLAPSPWETIVLEQSNIDPYSDRGGDYLMSSRNGFVQSTWNGACYAWRNEGGNAVPHVYLDWFGRSTYATEVPELGNPLVSPGNP